MNKIFVFFSIIIFSLVICSYFFVDQNIEALSMFYTGLYGTERLFVSFLYFLIIVSFFLVYLYILKNSNRFKNFLLISFFLILAYPAMLSFDIFNYILTAKLTFFYFENPYVVMPIEIINEPMLAFTHAANKFALYGPSWIGLTAVPFILGFNNLFLTILNFKLLAATFLILHTILLKKITRSNFSVIFFSLNPLVLIETLLSGHNDIVMMYFSLLSIHLFQKQKRIMGVIFFVLSILIKYSTFVLLPLVIYLIIISINKKKLKTEVIGKIGFFLMLIIFLLSALREEIYPWYAIWFLTFAALNPKNRFIFILSTSLSFCLMLRYIPFMYFGTHFGISKPIKSILVLLPVFLSLYMPLIESIRRKNKINISLIYSEVRNYSILEKFTKWLKR